MRVAIDEAPPVELVADRVDDVRDVGAVEALALHDQPLRPDHLLGRNQLHVDVEDDAVDRVVEPQLVDDRDAVAGAEDQVDEVVALERLAEPVRKRELRLVAGRLEDAASPSENPRGG